jgi:glycosyltransferase involved in cell wall biosynthesis
MARFRIAIVIPALNESTSIGTVVGAASRFGPVVVVDDGSTDDTAAIAASAGAHVVRLERNRGYDGAIDAGFGHAATLDADAIVTLDADGQHDPQLLPRFIAELEEGAEVVIGVRDRTQRLAEKLFARVASKRWSIRDPLCGMKAYRITVYRALGHFDSYRSIGTELALFAASRGFLISQLPFMTRDRVGIPRFGRRLVGNWRIFRALAIGLVRWPSQPAGAVSR